MDFATSLRELGLIGWDFLLLPIVLWTLMSLLALSLMKYSENINTIFQYHGRIALICALPAGLMASLAAHWLNTYGEAAGQFATKFIVIQSPLSVSASGNTTETILWMDPTVWGGLLLAGIAIVSIYLIFKLAIDFISLSHFAGKLSKKPIAGIAAVSERNIQIVRGLGTPVKLAFSSEVAVPFTFGWLKPVIVIPKELRQKESAKMNLAVHHELMHIKHKDYALNAVMMLVKALFWFHPIVHKLYAGFKEFREISCDIEVLSDASVSKKFYAQLLFELSSNKSLKNTPAVSMAVNSSTLKKRIQVMSSQKQQKSMFKTSFYIMLVSALFMTGIMACSDIHDSGITNKDIESAQSEMVTKDADTQPLYVMNGEIMEASESKDILSRLKPEYIKSIHILKGEDALKEYGKQGKHGVIKLQLADTEKAFDDLLTSTPEKPKEPFNPKEDFFVVVEDMPELKGGMTALQQKVSYPEAARNAGIEGRVIVQFIVNKQGQVENPKIIKGIGGGADAEALRVVKETEFTPGMQKGQPVRVQYSLPIIFKLSENNSE